MNPHLRKFLVALVVALLTVVLTHEEILKLGLFQRLEMASVDYRFQSRGQDSTVADSSHVIIVEINDESFKSLPVRWPWPRSYYARLVRNLAGAGARVVGIDVILNEPDAYSSRNDDDLRAAIRETGIVVLAGKFDSRHERFEMIAENENFGNMFFPIDSSLGLVNIRSDADGIYRRYSPYWEAVRVQRHDTVRIPTFSFAVLNKYLGHGPLHTADNRADHFLYGGKQIPKYDPASILINFHGPSGTFRRVKFVDVIDDETLTTREEAATGEEINTFSDPDFGYKYDGTFRNKIVLVGSTTPEDHDLFPVSIALGTQQGDNLMYGVQMHANVIESVLRNNFLTKQSLPAELLVILLASFVTFYSIAALRTLRSVRHFVVELICFCVVLAEIVAIAWMAVWQFTVQSYVMAAISPMVAVLGGYVASTAYNFVTERKQRLMIKSMFSTYVNPAVVEELIADPDKLKLGGERKHLTVMFSDIEGFTTISERMPSDQLVALLNEYFSNMTDIILRNSGTLDKFFGDAIIAFWGAPLSQEDHALRASVTALEMQTMLAELRARWRHEGKPVIHTRIGINTGDMVVGNMGGAEKFDYTVIGDSVNIASRLEGANKLYRVNVMVSESTYEAVKHKVLGREIDLLSIKGRSEPVRTFELLCPLDGRIEPDLQKFLTIYAEGLRLYRSRQWDAAESCFRSALALRGDDTPSRLYLDRAAFFRANPPPPDWNGVFEMTTK